MSENRENINELLQVVIKNLNWDECNIHFKDGTRSGDNYVGALSRVQLIGKTKDNENKVLDLILKYTPSSPLQRKVYNCEKCFAREIFMYETVLPYFKKMEEISKIEQRQRLKYPKLYGACRETGKEALVLEDLSVLGCVLKDRTKPLDFLHCKIVMEEIAKFHAFSFALKEQNPSIFEEFTKDLRNIFVTRERYEKYADEYKNAIRLFKYILEDNYTTEQMDKLEKYELEFIDTAEMFDSPGILGDYGVIVHGDTWINNIMFQYEESDDINGKPRAVVFIDYQISSYASPVIDIVYLIYMSTEKALREQHMDDLFNIYYKSLGENLAAFGSDVKKLFPYHVFQEQIKKFSSYGFFTGVLLIHLFLANSQDEFDRTEMLHDPNAHNEKVWKKATSDESYRNRLKDIFYEMCDKHYI